MNKSAEFGAKHAASFFSGRKGHGNGPCSYATVSEPELAAIIAAAFDAGAADVAHWKEQYRRMADSQGWRCFWCNAVFLTRDEAEAHFGKPYGGKPAPECAHPSASTWISESGEVTEKAWKGLTRSEGI